MTLFPEIHARGLAAHLTLARHANQPATRTEELAHFTPAMRAAFRAALTYYATARPAPNSYAAAAAWCLATYR